MSISPAVQEKLKTILARKASRGGQFSLPFAAENLPFRIRETFPGYKKYALEIGCGWGEFTRASAMAEPTTLIIAVEKKLARVLSSSTTQQKEAIANIRYLILDIAWFFEGVFSPDTFDAVTINFPDPWPKARHHKHRFVSPEFAETLAGITRNGARVTFATDNYRYAREAAQTFETSARWKNIHGAWLAPGKIPGRPVSYFEQIHRDEGAPIYFLEYAKR